MSEQHNEGEEIGLQPEQSDSAICFCGHSAYWHAREGRGDCEHDGDCGCSAFAKPGDVKNDLRRMFAKHGLNVSVGHYDDGGLFLQSHDERLVTLTRGDRRS